MKRSVPKIILIAFSLLAFMFVLVGTTLFSRNEATVSVLDFSKAVTELNSKNTDVNFSPVILNDELLTEDANTTIGLNDFCQQTNTNVEYVGNNINLSFGEYSATINTQEGLIYTNTSNFLTTSLFHKTTVLFLLVTFAKALALNKHNFQVESKFQEHSKQKD